LRLFSSELTVRTSEVMKILVLGITGMLGSAIFRRLSGNGLYQVFGTMRSAAGKRYFPRFNDTRLITNLDVLDPDALISVFESVRPNVVVNCVGLIKQHAEVNDPLIALPINAMLPLRLARLCGMCNARMIHFGTDCVFSVVPGMLVKKDLTDARDLYGKSKFIGEVSDAPHVVTLRTSIIGHELDSNLALIDWFLSQTGTVKGYSKAIFSGLTTCEMARVVDEFVISLDTLSGMYHVSVNPISKFSLFQLVAKVYRHDVEIVPDEAVCIDRSLDSSRFCKATGYVPPEWPALIDEMYRQR